LDLIELTATVVVTQVLLVLLVVVMMVVVVVVVMQLCIRAGTAARCLLTGG
jgi:hypothetical protein